MQVYLILAESPLEYAQRRLRSHSCYAVDFFPFFRAMKRLQVTLYSPIRPWT